MDKLKCHKIGTNDKTKGKKATKKVRYLFLGLECINADKSTSLEVVKEEARCG